MPTTSAGLYTTAAPPAPTPVEPVSTQYEHIVLTSSGQNILTKDEIMCLLNVQLDEIKIWRDRGFTNTEKLESYLDRAKFFVNMLRQTKA